MAKKSLIILLVLICTTFIMANTSESVRTKNKTSFTANMDGKVVLLSPVQEVQMSDPVPIDAVLEEDGSVMRVKKAEIVQNLMREKHVLGPVEKVDWPSPIPVRSNLEDVGRFGPDVTIGIYDYIDPVIARVPGSSSIFFAAAYDQSGYVDVYKTSNGGSSWPVYDYNSVSSVVNDASPDIAVTSSYVFVVYEDGGDIYVKKYDHSLNLLATYDVATTSDPEYYPAITTDAESYSSARLYVVWTANDGNPGTEVYFRVWTTSWSPQSSVIGIFGAGSLYNFEYPDISFDNSSSDRVHTVCWQRSQDYITYRGATNFGTSSSDWGSAFYWTPSSGYDYRLPRVDSEGNRVLVTWERINSDVRTFFAYSTTGGINSGNFNGPYYFTTQMWRPVSVLANTSSYWYLIVWYEVASNSYRAAAYRTTSPTSSWDGKYVSDGTHSLLPWFSFDGITCGDNYPCVVWADGSGMWFDRDWVAVEENPKFEQPPAVFALSQNFPNPVFSSTVIKYALPKKSKIELEVYDKSGRQIAILLNKEQKSGYYTVNWDIKDVSKNKLPNGVYFYRLKTGDFTETKKMVVVR